VAIVASDVNVHPTFYCSVFARLGFFSPKIKALIAIHSPRTGLGEWIGPSPIAPMLHLSSTHSQGSEHTKIRQSRALMTSQNQKPTKMLIKP